MESQSLAILQEAYKGLVKLSREAGRPLPVNKEANRRLDCAVIRYIHQTRKDSNEAPYDTIRSAFDEGDRIYEGANFTLRHHIQVCVINPLLIKAYFLPRPIEEFNPFLKTPFS